MSDHTQSIQHLLELAFQHAATSATAGTSRSVAVEPSDPPEGQALLRFDVNFQGESTLSWFVSNADATGYADLLIGGSGDRSATLTEMHLDALSAAFSEMLERAVDGINAGLVQPIAAGGVDMGMESALPDGSGGAVILTRAFVVEGFGPLAVYAVANPALVQQVLPYVRTNDAAAEAPQQPQAAAVAPADATAQPQPTPAGATPPLHEVSNVVELPNLADRTGSERSQGDLRMLLNVPLNVTVELGRTERTVRDLLQLGVGSVIELAKLAGDPMDIMVNDRVLARGEVVVIDEEFGIRITEIVSPEERLRSSVG